MSYAATQESGSVSFPSAVRVGTNNLPAGTYAVRWQPGSSDVQVTLSGHGQKVSIPATVAPGTGADEVLLHRDGSAQVVEGFTVKETSFTIKKP
jgi:virulence-associated protein VagC